MGKPSTSCFNGKTQARQQDERPDRTSCTSHQRRGAGSEIRSRAWQTFLIRVRKKKQSVIFSSSILISPRIIEPGGPLNLLLGVLRFVNHACRGKNPCYINVVLIFLECLQKSLTWIVILGTENVRFVPKGGQQHVEASKQIWFFPSVSSLFLLDSFHRSGWILDRKFCLSVCPFVCLSSLFPSPNIEWIDGFTM